jgi:hypothetical protein
MTYESMLAETLSFAATKEKWARPTMPDRSGAGRWPEWF